MPALAFSASPVPTAARRGHSVPGNHPAGVSLRQMVQMDFHLKSGPGNPGREFKRLKATRRENRREIEFWLLTTGRSNHRGHRGQIPHVPRPPPPGNRGEPLAGRTGTRTRTRTYTGPSRILSAPGALAHRPAPILANRGKYRHRRPGTGQLRPASTLAKRGKYRIRPGTGQPRPDYYRPPAGSAGRPRIGWRAGGRARPPPLLAQHRKRWPGRAHWRTDPHPYWPIAGNIGRAGQPARPPLLLANRGKRWPAAHRLAASGNAPRRPLLPFGPACIGWPRYVEHCARLLLLAPRGKR
jgi:hypothetical protein